MSARVTHFRRKFWMSGLCFICLGPLLSRSEPKAIRRTAVESSSIASVGYGGRSRLLEIEFRSGAIYRYRGVPKSVFNAFSAASSRGVFFSAQIRGKYDFDKIRGPNP